MTKEGDKVTFADGSSYTIVPVSDSCNVESFKTPDELHEEYKQKYIAAVKLCGELAEKAYLYDSWYGTHSHQDLAEVDKMIADVKEIKEND